MAESRGDAQAHNPEWHYSKGEKYCQGSYGLMQISCHGGVIYDPEKNIEAAWAKYQARGWKPWGAYNNGSYKKFLK